MPFIPILRPTTYGVVKRFIKDRTARVGVMGLGRIGMRLAIQFSRAGFHVLGFDFDSTRANKLRPRKKYLWDIDVDSAISIRDRGIHTASDLSQIAETDVMIACFPLLHGDTREVDLRIFRETAFALASRLRSGQLIVVESPADSALTEDVVLPILEGGNGEHLRVSRNTGATDEFFVGISPRSEHDTFFDPRTSCPVKFVGGADMLGMELTADLYSTICSRVVPVPCPTRADVLTLLERANGSARADTGFRNKLERLSKGSRHDDPGVGTSVSVVPIAAIDSRFNTAGTFSVPIDPFYIAWKQNELGIHLAPIH